jgi:tetratricopeptide (TPR) repeat protein
MKSLTVLEACKYCSQPAVRVALSEDNTLFYKETTLPRFIVKTPVEMRQIIQFVLTLTNATKIPTFEGALVWFTQYDVGVADSARLGWKIIENTRLAHGDPSSLDRAPAQYFRRDEELELQVFLLQAMIFGWSGYFLPSGFDCLVSFRTSERWFFHSSEQENLSSLFAAMEPWSPSYEDNEELEESARELFRQAEERMVEGDLKGAVELYKSSLRADPYFFEAARGLITALKRGGQNEEAEAVQQRLIELE